eukprot:272597-Chlamydomonas_euryale.AAC.1
MWRGRRPHLQVWIQRLQARRQRALQQRIDHFVGRHVEVEEASGQVAVAEVGQHLPHLTRTQSAG